jgi:hypothetical protein
MFRIVDVQTMLCQNFHKTLPGIDACCTSAFLGRQWAVTPKLTMIAGRQLSIGALPVWNALLDFTIADKIRDTSL